MKKLLLPSMIIASLFLVGCGNKTIQNGDTVSLTMTGSFENQQLFENRDATITVGSGNIISGIETALIGMKKGESKTVTIQPENGYGKNYKSTNIAKISKLIFDKMQIATTGSDIIDLAGLKGVIKGTETDGSGYVMVLFDQNPPQTWKPLIYNILVTDIVE